MSYIVKEVRQDSCLVRRERGGATTCLLVSSPKVHKCGRAGDIHLPQEVFPNPSPNRSVCILRVFVFGLILSFCRPSIWAIAVRSFVLPSQIPTLEFRMCTPCPCKASLRNLRASIVCTRIVVLCLCTRIVVLLVCTRIEFFLVFSALPFQFLPSISAVNFCRHSFPFTLRFIVAGRRVDGGYSRRRTPHSMTCFLSY